MFKSAFVELYYTGDLFSGLFVSTIFLTDLARKGYETQEERKKMTVKAVWVAGIASVIVYSGLLIMGADAVKLFDQGIDRTTLLAEMVRMILGKFGTIALSASAALACLHGLWAGWNFCSISGKHDEEESELSHVGHRIVHFRSGYGVHRSRKYYQCGGTGVYAAVPVRPCDYCAGTVQKVCS